MPAAAACWDTDAMVTRGFIAKEKKVLGSIVDPTRSWSPGFPAVGV